LVHFVPFVAYLDCSDYGAVVVSGGRCIAPELRKKPITDSFSG
jgi:hypothetical protein